MSGSELSLKIHKDLDDSEFPKSVHVSNVGDWTAIGSVHFNYSVSQISCVGLGFIAG